MNESFPPALTRALRAARYIAVLTGAGISAESGVPTFREAQPQGRGPTALWAQYNPTELATPQAFQRDPQLVWDWYAWRRKLVAGVEPNPGHLALVALEKHAPQFTLITQNVDGLHQRAGSTAVIELHGNISRIKCSREDVVVETWAETDEAPPRCARCGARLRPDVVWFGESLPPHALHAAAIAARTCDLFFSIGTSGLVEPAASLPYEALRHGATVIQINPNETPLTSVATYALSGPSGVVLPQLVRAAWPGNTTQA